MTRPVLAAVCAVLALLSVPHLSFGEDLLLYAPKPVTADQAPASPDQGVLVRSVVVKRGDTLRKLASRHIGVASYFPQVLLFNTVKNPDLIYPGEKLLFPVRPGHPASEEKETKAKGRPAARRPSYRKASIHRMSRAAAAATSGEQESYQRAKRAYLSGDYHKSLDLFDSFLRRYPDSKLAADASLYRADCYLHLSSSP